jgi:transmembrane protein
MRNDHQLTAIDEPKTLLTRLITSIAVCGCALYPSPTSIALMAELLADRGSRRDPERARHPLAESGPARAPWPWIGSPFSHSSAAPVANSKGLPMNNTIERLLRWPIATVAARIAVTFPFWLSGLSKLAHFDAGVAEMAHFELQPAAAFTAATIIVQLAGSLLIILGRYVWLGTGVLCVFTGLTVPLAHHFWSITEEPFRTIALHTASEHVGLLGGLLAVAILSARPGPDVAVGENAKA